MNEWEQWIEKIKNQPKEPRTIFVDAVENRIHELTGECINMLFAVQDIENNPKADADFSRILEIIHDFFDDEASVEETADQVRDFLVCHGYLKK